MSGSTACVGLQPYRSPPAEKAIEKSLPWYIESPPTQEEKALWIRFYDTWRVWSNGERSPAELFELTDTSMKQYRSRFSLMR